MILLLLSSIIIKAVRLIIGLLPGISIEEYVVPDLITEIINLLNYILPMDTLNTLFGLTLVITGFRVVLAIINKILDIIEVL